MTDAEKEQIKLTANFVNGLALAIFAVGGIAPIVSTLYSAAAPSVPTGVVVLSGMICTTASGALHWIARRVLRGLSP